MRLDIECPAPSNPKLLRRVWRFYISATYGTGGISARLEYFAEQSRPTTRHRNWEDARSFSDSDRLNRYCKMRREDVPITPEVIAKIHAAVLANITII